MPIQQSFDGRLPINSRARERGGLRGKKREGREREERERERDRERDREGREREERQRQRERERAGNR